MSAPTAARLGRASTTAACTRSTAPARMPAGPPGLAGAPRISSASAALHLPTAVAQQGDSPTVRADPRHLQVVASDHHVHVSVRAVEASAASARPCLVKRITERHVRDRVLVDQPVDVDPPGAADTRRGVDQRDLTKPIGVADTGEVAAQKVPVAPFGAETDEPTASE